jgi:hypothetical protein
LWVLKFFTVNKMARGWAIVDWVARPMPNVSPVDGASADP